MASEDSTKVSGSSRHTIDFDLMDDEVKKGIIECIKKRGKISVVLEEKGVIDIGQAAAFRQLID